MHSDTDVVRQAMKAAAKSGTRKTYRQWSDEFSVSINVVYMLVSREGLRGAITLDRRGRKPYSIPNQNAAGSSYIKTEYRIGKSALASADLIGKKLRQVIDGGRIIIEPDCG